MCPLGTPAPKGHGTKQPIKSTKTDGETAKKGNNFFLLSEQGAPDFLFALDPTNDVAGRGSIWCLNLRSVRVLSCRQGVPTRTAFGGLIRALPIGTPLAQQFRFIIRDVHEGVCVRMFTWHYF